MGLELVIFDMDGLMFNTEAVYYRAWSEIVRNMGKDPSLKLFSRSLGGHAVDITVHYSEHFGREITLSDIDSIFENSFAIFDRILSEEGLGIKNGLFELMDILENKKIKKAIGSSSPKSVIHRYLESAGIPLNRFDTITSGDMVSNLKPDPEIFEKTCNTLHVLPKNTLVLEDAKNGLRAATTAGMKCVIVPDLSAPDDEMKQMAFKIAESLCDVADIIQNW